MSEGFCDFKRVTVTMVVIIEDSEDLPPRPPREVIYWMEDDGALIARHDPYEMSCTGCGVSVVGETHADDCFVMMRSRRGIEALPPVRMRTRPGI